MRAGIELGDAIQELIDDGLMRDVQDADAADRRQRGMLARLLARNCRDDSELYTTVYDSMMRIAEISTLTGGVEFGDQPHRALKNLACALDPGFRVDDVVAVRHRVKQTNAIPNARELEALTTARERLASLVGLSHLLP